MRQRRYWSDEEDERLCQLAVAGKPDAEIASILGRSKQAVLMRRTHTHGIHIRKHWTDEEDARLKELLTTTDKPLSEIANILGRSESGTEHRKERLGIRRVPFRLDKFNPMHIAQLIKFKMAGWTQLKIAEAWGIKNSSQISRVLQSHGFHRLFACVGEKNQQRWSEVELHYLRKCLKKGMPFSEVYRQFSHRSPSSVNSKAREITKHWLSPAEKAKRRQQRENHMKWRVY